MNRHVCLVAVHLTNHDRILISFLKLSWSKVPSGGLLYNRNLGRHIKKCLFNIYKWTTESLNSLCDLTSAANLVNILTDCGVARG